MSAYPSPERPGQELGRVRRRPVPRRSACFNIFDGIAALANDDYFAADELLFGDLSMWGTVYPHRSARSSC